MLDDENMPSAGPSRTTSDASAPDTAAGSASGTGAENQTEAAADSGGAEVTGTAAKKTTKRAPAKKTAKKAPAKKASTRRTTKKAAAAEEATAGATPDEQDPGQGASAESQAAPAETAAAEAPAKKTAKRAPRKTAAKRTTKKAAAPKAAEQPEPASHEQLGDLPAVEAPPAQGADEAAAAASSAESAEEPRKASASAVTAPLFQPPDPTKAVTPKRRRSAKRDSDDGAAEAERAAEQKPSRSRARKAAEPAEQAAGKPVEEDVEEDRTTGADDGRDRAEGEESSGGRRRRRGGRRRRRSGGGEGDGDSAEAEGSPDRGKGEDAQPAAKDEAKRGGKEAKQDSDEDEGTNGSRRRRRRRRSGDAEGSSDASEATATKVRKPRGAEDEITALTGSTRLEAKKQRRREGREAGRRRAPIVSEAEFLARRESVDRVMVIRQRDDLTQIAVLEDKVLVEHYVSRESQTSLIGNVYLGRVQNVLPSMEAAFIDIGKGRNAVLYAGEVNWDALGHKNGSPRKIESVLKSGQSILVQVTKDPAGHKGARLTSQISLPGRFLVYVPDGTTSGISRKLPDTERNRLKNLLKEIVPESAGVIVRTAAEGASEQELTRDVERLTARWEDIEKKSRNGNAPQLLYGEPDLTLKVVRDLFTEDFNKLVIAGDDAWDMVQGYVDHMAPDLAHRLEKYDGDRDVFSEYRIDEQIEKALDRKVWLPSGGSLVIDRTEAMTVVDVNTGKFTGSGGNLEETVTKNNLEAAEEIVRQLRLRDIGGIVVVDFIDMVLESNRDLVLRRLVECLGRDRTRHQVAEVTSLGLVQMTRKRIGTGLLEAFSEPCEHCNGRGLVLHHEPVELRKKNDDDQRRGRRGRGRGRDEGKVASAAVPSPKEFAAMAKADDKEPEAPEEQQSSQARSRPAQNEPAASDERSTVEEPAKQPADSSEPSRPEEPEEPVVKVSTRTRRRRAVRPVSQAEPAEVPPSTTAASSTSVPSTDTAAPADEDASRQPRVTSSDEPTGGDTSPGEQSAPTVVTSVRRRSARRAAGPPPAEATSGGAGVATLDQTSQKAAVPTEDGTDEPGDSEPLATLLDAAEATDVEPAGTEEAGEESATPHVPVKKRGARRR